jgi:hypothetical protein
MNEEERELSFSHLLASVIAVRLISNGGLQAKALALITNCPPLSISLEVPSVIPISSNRITFFCHCGWPEYLARRWKLESETLDETRSAPYRNAEIHQSRDVA